MKLKDIVELGTYGYNPECKVDIFDMKNFEEAMENDSFFEVLLPADEESTIYPYAFLIEDSVLIAMAEEKGDEKEDEKES